MTWYMKGQSNYDNATGFHMGMYLDMNGFAQGAYDDQRMPGTTEVGDPFMAFGAKTAPWILGQQQVEWGLWGEERIRVDSSGIWGWHVGSGVWLSLYSGGGAVPDHNDLVGLNDGTDYEHITQTQKDDIHTRQHGIATAADHTMTANRILYSTNGAVITELALGADTKYLMSNGPAVAPTWEDVPAGYTDAEADARIVVQNTHPAGTIDIAIDALILTHKNIAGDHHTKYTDAEVQALSINGLDEDASPSLAADLDIGTFDINGSTGKVYKAVYN